MKRTMAVLNGDNVNRYGYAFSVGALEQSLFNYATVGLPSLLGHDCHRPIGWIYPIGLYFEPGTTKLVGEFLLAENSNDQRHIETAFQNKLIQRSIDAGKSYSEKLLNLLKTTFNPNGNIYENGCVYFQDDGIVFRNYPELDKAKDKDGLIFLKELLIRFEYLGQGVFKDKKSELSIFCHHFFRRNLSRHNNFHNYFLDEFMGLNTSNDVILRIAIDPDIVGYAPTFNEQFELEYWWGPQFNDKIDTIPIGVTHYECTESQRLFSGLSGTQFWWKRDSEGMSLELEEIRERPSLGVSYDKYGCRYIHAIHDSETKTFSHFDGAIRMYNENEMLQRLEIPINKSGKNTDYIKLFRIDGKLEVSKWKSLSLNYYQDNPLLYEYFGLKEGYEKLQKDLTIGNDKTVLESLVPYKLNEENGLRLFVSYHNLTTIDCDFERIVINPDELVRLKDTLKVVEFDILEVKKALNRIGNELLIPKNYSFIRSIDYYTNYPTILHSKKNLEEKLKTTLGIYLKLFKLMAKNLHDCFSITLAWPIADKEVRLSVYGNIVELISWLNENQSIPLNHNEFRSWLDGQKKWLSEKYLSKNNKPDLFDLVNNDGVIYIKRQTINPDWITDISLDEKGLKYKLLIPEGNEELLEALKLNKLYVENASVVLKATCEKTNENYFTSKTSKILDEDVRVIIEKHSLSGFFWTDKQ